MAKVYYAAGDYEAARAAVIECKKRGGDPGAKLVEPAAKPGL